MDNNINIFNPLNDEGSAYPGKGLSPEEAAEAAISDRLSRHFGVTFETASDQQMYNAVALAVKDKLLRRRNRFKAATKENGTKRVYYLCMEFLIGRSLKNNLYNMGLSETYEKVLKKHGFNLDDLYELEPDAGLGNGGLGRLAACFMDSLATLGYNATGFSILYEYGLFKQKIVDGWQIELPDVWLPGGSVWLNQRKYIVARLYYACIPRKVLWSFITTLMYSELLSSTPAGNALLMSWANQATEMPDKVLGSLYMSLTWLRDKGNDISPMATRALLGEIQRREQQRKDISVETAKAQNVPMTINVNGDTGQMVLGNGKYNKLTDKTND